jgi:hypothetical protein
MATLKNSTVSRFHNLTAEALADAIGRADAIVKGAGPNSPHSRTNSRRAASPMSPATSSR